MGIELYNNVRQAWWRWMVYERDDMEGLDSSIILNRKVWQHSGHEATFHDWLVDCKKCKNRFRADKVGALSGVTGEGTPTFGEFRECEVCGANDWTKPRAFNTMLETRLGAVAEDD